MYTRKTSTTEENRSYDYFYDYQRTRVNLSFYQENLGEVKDKINCQILTHLHLMFFIFKLMKKKSRLKYLVR